MQRSTLAAFPLRLILLSKTCLQAKASPVPRSFHIFKDSPWGCLTVIFFLVLSLTILFILKKTYVAQRRKIDDRAPIFSDEFSVLASNRKVGSSMTKAIAKRSGFYVGLLGSPGWETKRSVLIGGDPRHISFPTEGRTPNCCRIPSGSSTTTILHKVPARCEIISTRPAPSNISEDKLQPLHVVDFSSELSRPSPVMVHPKRPSPCLDTKSPLRLMGSPSPLITQDDQRDNFQSNENIALNSGPRNSTLVPDLNSPQSQIDHFKSSSVSSFVDFKDERRFPDTCDSSTAEIAIPTSAKHTRSPTDLPENSIQQSKVKPLHFGSISKRCAHAKSEKYKQLYSDDANESRLKTAAQDFSNVSPPKASHKIPDSPKFCRQFVDLSSNSARLKPQYPTPSKRTRNSPIIGPSPLRTMSLPSDYDLEHTKKLNVSTLSKIQSEVTFEPSIHSPPSTSHSSPIPRRSKTVLQPDDPDIIIDLIRELAQETSEWDASLFLDENFKAMMDQSKIHPACKLKIQTAQQRRSKYRREHRTTSFIPLQDIPESEVATVFSEENGGWHPDEAQSFWEDEIDFAYQCDVQPHAPSLGIAC